MLRISFKYFYTSLFLFILSSCDRTTGFNEANHIIQNSSNHKIWLEYNPKRGVEGAVVLEIGNDIKSQYFEENAVPNKVPFGGVGLFKVIYDDTVSIQHTASFTQTIARSILRSDNWVGGEVGEQVYTYTYTFTDEDYQEAFDNQRTKVNCF